MKFSLLLNNFKIFVDDLKSVDFEKEYLYSFNFTFLQRGGHNPDFFLPQNYNQMPDA